MQANNQQLKDIILNSITDAQNKGYTLICDAWGSTNSKCACALGCVLVSNDRFFHGDEPETEIITKTLGVSIDWVESFIDGFDDNGYAEGSTIPDAWLLGHEIREQTQPRSDND